MTTSRFSTVGGTLKTEKLGAGAKSSPAVVPLRQKTKSKNKQIAKGNHGQLSRITPSGKSQGKGYGLNHLHLNGVNEEQDRNVEEEKG
ncbi:hypothetical protein HO133_009698 [Letharia lupina]|uniref:Uncharacterized protein n=1 Tax=Letharia lupina TaxID=560253 RepID=A0A8H6CLK7_9LECA|nr:uncharacterized protein HO133_009698 [Letharia lupina]KAF6225698.1 hypothetical protein HO133_009698 [Letharia lupina]